MMQLVTSVGLQASTKTAHVAYSCDIPLILQLSRANFPSNFALTVTITGSGFGIYQASPVVRVGSTLAKKNVWISHSSLIFIPNFGTTTRLPGANVQFSALERNSAENNRSFVLYDRSRINSVSLEIIDTVTDPPKIEANSIYANVVLIFNTIGLRLLGKNFGMDINEVSVFVGSTQFPVYDVNDASIAAYVRNGVGKNLIISLNVSGDVSQSGILFSYNAPSNVRIDNRIDQPICATTGSCSVTIHGKNFGDVAYSDVVKLGATSAFCNLWTSDIALVCRIPPGVGKSLVTVVSVFGQSSSSIDLCSYSAPNMSSFIPNSNSIPSSGSTSVLVFGVMFGSSDSTVAMKLGLSNYKYSKWLSDSSISAKIGVLSSPQPLQFVTIASQGHHIGTSLLVTEPVICTNSTNIPSTGSTFAIISGANLGIMGMSPTTRTVPTASESTQWTSDSRIVLKQCLLNSKNVLQSMITSLQRQTKFIVTNWTHDVPTLKNTSNNAATTGSMQTSVYGDSLGACDSTPRIRIGKMSTNAIRELEGSACKMTKWHSSSSAVCKAGGGVGGGARGGQGLPVVVSAGLQSGSLTRAWSYDAAEVSAAGGASNGPSSGSVSVSVAGQGLGSRGYSGAARVGRGAASEGDVTGGTACEASRWLSSSSAVCKVGGGVGGGARRGQGLPVVVSAGLQSGSLTQAWSYDAAEVCAAGGAINGP
jgi:hypothetical protein